MTRLDQLKELILSLTPEEFAAFCKWYDTFRPKEREEQMAAAAAVQVGRCNKLVG